MVGGGFTYWTETWAIKAETLHRLKKTYYGEMDVWSVVEGQNMQCEFAQSSRCSRVWLDVERCGRLSWFKHSKLKGVDDRVSVSAYRNVMMTRVRCAAWVATHRETV